MFAMREKIVVQSKNHNDDRDRFLFRLFLLNLAVQQKPALN